LGSHEQTSTGCSGEHNFDAFVILKLVDYFGNRGEFANADRLYPKAFTVRFFGGKCRK